MPQSPHSPIPNTQYPIPNPTPSRPRWLYIFAILVMVVATIPYIMGFAAQGTEWRFTGFVFGVEDGNSYIAKMLGGAAGKWLFRTPYSAVPQRSVIIYLPYLLLGKLTAPPAQHAQLVVLFHLFRFGAGILAILASYDFMALFIARPSLRRWGVVLVSLGGGLGWALLMLGQKDWLGWLPLEFYSPESFGFLALYGLPHLAISRALLLWGLRAYLLGVTSRTTHHASRFTPHVSRFTLHVPHNPRRSLLAGVYWLIMGFFQPLAVVVGWGVLGAHLLVLGFFRVVAYLNKTSEKLTPGELAFPLERGNRKSWKLFFQQAVVIGLISSPIVVYTAVAFNIDPVLSSWAAQNLITSPPFPHYLLAYGVLLPFAALSIWRIARAGERQAWLPAAWVCALPIFVYAPYNLQRRLAEGVWIALVVLALKALENLPEKKRFRWSLLWTLTLPSTLILLAGGTMAALTPAQPLFRPTAEVAAFQYLAQNAEADAVVLASRQTGNPLPAWAPLQVVVGHGPETIHAEEILPRVRAFYQVDTSPDERQALLDEYQVDYIFYGPAERDLGDWDPARAEYLTPVYQDGDYAIFVVDD